MFLLKTLQLLTSSVTIKSLLRTVALRAFMTDLVTPSVNSFSACSLLTRCSSLIFGQYLINSCLKLSKYNAKLFLQIQLFCSVGCSVENKTHGPMPVSSCWTCIVQLPVALWSNTSVLVLPLHSCTEEQKPGKVHLWCNETSQLSGEDTTFPGTGAHVHFLTRTHPAWV